MSIRLQHTQLRPRGTTQDIPKIRTGTHIPASTATESRSGLPDLDLLVVPPRGLGPWIYPWGSWFFSVPIPSPLPPKLPRLSPFLADPGVDGNRIVITRVRVRTAAPVVG